MKKLEVANLDLSGKVETLEHIFDNMHAKAGGLSQAGYLLGGDTGVGKTSFVRDLGTLLGLEVILIETPHIVEEHIIDIPFIVVKPTGTSSNSHLHLDTQSPEFDIQLAKSNLYSQLEDASKSSDAALLKAVNSREDIKLIWNELGGSEKTIPNEIKEIRAKYRVILFLDEYFRQTTSAIRNMLRSILNGRIGSNPIQSDVYTIFASNLVDQGVGDILENEDFRMIDFDTPDTDSWFAYMLTKYKSHPDVKLNDALMHKFYELMKKNKGTLSSDDFDADVRVSPRRWEQLLLYINSSFPIKSKADADMLLKNVQINFQNYKTGDKAEILEDVMKALKELIKDEFDVEGDAGNISDDDWRDTLKHQIEVKMKLGNARKYIPVIGGAPGAGKTKHIVDLATDLNLVPVFVDVQNLSPEEVIGTPIGTKAGKELSVKFSKPALWADIQTQMQRGEDHLKERLVKFFGKEKGEQRFKTWKGQKMKYLIFFDELNRTNTKVFNAIRKVLLEKEFSPEYKLPEDAVVVAAVNPEGKGTQELTKHVRDVFDVIPVGVSWPKFKKHIDGVELNVSKEAESMARAAWMAFIDRFRVSGAGKVASNADPHFFLNLGAAPLYISGREYTDMLVNMARTADRAYKREEEKLSDPDHDVNQSEEKIRKALARAAEHSLKYIVKVKHGFDSQETIDDITDWFLHTDDFTLGEMFKRKVDTVKDLKGLLSRPFENKDEHLFNDIEFVNYITSIDPVVFKEQLTDFLTDEVVTDAKRAFETYAKQKNMDPDTLAVKVVEDEVSKLEFVTREILHAIKAHDISNKMREMAQQAVRQMNVKLADDDDNIEAVVEFNSKINQYIRKLFPVKK